MDHSPFYEVTVESAIDSTFGIALIGGYGEVTTAGRGVFDRESGLYEIGVSSRYYMVGSFAHGMQLGFESTYLGGHAEQDNLSFALTPTGLTVGAFIGYKYLAPFGLTPDTQLGASEVFHGTDSTVPSAGRAFSESETRPLLNINFGRSF